MNRFKRYYLISTTALIAILALSFLSSLFAGEVQTELVAFAVLASALSLVPILRSGGIDRHRRSAVAISMCFATGFATIQGFVFIEFVRTNGFEGPNGEGAPGAAISAMVFFALLIVCPWLLTALRGMRLWNI